MRISDLWGVPVRLWGVEKRPRTRTGLRMEVEKGPCHQ